MDDGGDGYGGGEECLALLCCGRSVAETQGQTPVDRYKPPPDALAPAPLQIWGGDRSSSSRASFLPPATTMRRKCRPREPLHQYEIGMLAILR
jgi:hypothetical protein